MSKPGLIRTTALCRTTANIARKHPRVSLMAATAAAAGVLGTVGAAPWAQTADNSAKTVRGGSASASGQLNASLFQATGSAAPGDSKLLASAQFDTIRSVSTVGSVGATEANGATAAVGAAVAQHAAKQATQQSAAKRQAAQQQVAKSQAKQHQAAQRKAARPAAKPKAPAQPYLIYDSVTPGAIPAGQAAAVYADGPYAASAAQLTGHNSVLWIDTNGSDPAANALDVEPGDATPVGAAQWVQDRLSSSPKAVAIVYTMRSDWQQVKDDVAALPSWMQPRVRYWIADPTGVPHVVAGASATQWYWGNSYDITTANPDFVG